MAFLLRIVKSPFYLFVIALVVTGVAIFVASRLFGVEWVDSEIVLGFVVICLASSNLRNMYLLEKRDSIEADRQEENPDQTH